MTKTSKPYYAPDLEAEYNNRARVPECISIMAGWAQDAENYRKNAASRLRTLHYGDTQRQTISIFSPEKPNHESASVLFIHGGYWQALDPSSFSHLAKGLNQQGVTVGIAGYDLCPEVSIAQIHDQMIKACTAFHRDRIAHRLPSRIIVSGHSAGGHLAACLAATNWEDVDAQLPADLVPCALAISGLFELEPLVPTSINAKLELDITTARMLSPRLWLPPQGLTFEAWVGDDESPEYLRQSRGIAAVWAAAGNQTAYVEVKGANHFTVIAELSNPDSPMTRRLTEIALGLK